MIAGVPGHPSFIHAAVVFAPVVALASIWWAVRTERKKSLQGPSAFTLADRSIVLEDGRVGAFGDHDSLMRENDLYRRLVSESTDAGADR